MRRKRRRHVQIHEGMMVMMYGTLYRVIKRRGPYDWSQVKGARYG